MSITVEVTVQDIQNGERESYTCCPVALAIADTMGYVAEVSDQGWVVLDLEDEGKSANADLPDAVAERIRAYDEGGSMEPFRFELPEWRSGWTFPDGKPDPDDHDSDK